VDLLYAEGLPGVLSRHIRVRFKRRACGQRQLSATFLTRHPVSGRMSSLLFQNPMTGSANAFRRRYNARLIVEANLLRACAEGPLGA